MTLKLHPEGEDIIPVTRLVEEIFIPQPFQIHSEEDIAVIIEPIWMIL